MCGGGVVSDLLFWRAGFTPRFLELAGCGAEGEWCVGIMGVGEWVS